MIKKNSIWKHHKGGRYRVLILANTECIDEKFAPTVVYESMLNYKVFARPISDWMNKFKEVMPNESV